MEKNFKLSKYQEDIINFVKMQRGNLLVDAKAGSGKTSTLLLLADELTSRGNKCLFLAFNKHIVEELNEKISDTNNCIVKTVHSLGYSFIASYLYKKHGKNNYKLETDTNKLKNLVREYYDKYFRQKIDLYNATGVYDEEGLMSLQSNEPPVNQLDEKSLKQLHNDIISDFVGLCMFSRLYNVNYKQRGALDILVDKFCWKLSPFVDDVLADYQDLVIAVIDKTKELFENPELGPDNKPLYKIDFTDMIYFPVYYNMSIPYSVKQYIDTVLVDECIPEDMYIETSKRKMLFREVKRRVEKGEEILVKSFNEDTETFEFKPVVSVTDKGFKDVYEITTTGLNKVQATENHLFLTQDGWKRLDELNIGCDYLYLDKPDNQKTKYILNDDQLQIAYASILGDGSIDDNGFKYEYRLKFIQGDKQYNYFKFKKDMFNCVKEHKGESGYTHKMSINNTSTKMFLLPIKNKLDCIKSLDLKGLAILYMDDGSTSNTSRGWNTRIHCNNFNAIETDALINKLAEYGIECKNFPISRNNKIYNEIHINTNNSKIFFEKIAPYMHPDCFYKNPYSTGDYIWNNKFKQFGGNIVKSIDRVGVKHVLDMEVVDNHNFCVSKHHQKNGTSIVVHNCQDLSVLQQKFIQMLNTNFNRFIFMGDKFQSIYGFGGADTYALEKLDETFILQHLPLSICYRCPENIVKLAKDIVPTIEWNTAREDKGIVKLVTLEDVIENIQPNEVLIGRKNKDLIRLYRMFTLKLKKSVKFKNKELVNTLVNNIERVITEYINLYIKGVNIQKPLAKHMAEFIKNTGQISGTELYEAEYKNYKKNLIDKNTGKSGRIMRSNYTVSYLTKCMQEYKELGAYGEQEDDQLTEFYDVIQDFINEFTSNHNAKILVEDLKLYIKTFLSGNIYADVPIISSVHAMKGGEADTVYIYDYPLFPYLRSNMTSDDEQQEINLQYVAITRAKKNLYLVKSNDPR